MDNNSAGSEWKENFRLSHPTPGIIFWLHFVSPYRGNKQLGSHSIMNVPGVLVLCNRL